jgi:hypothetical protein
MAAPRPAHEEVQMVLTVGDGDRKKGKIGEIDGGSPLKENADGWGVDKRHSLFIGVHSEAVG